MCERLASVKVSVPPPLTRESPPRRRRCQDLSTHFSVSVKEEAEVGGGGKGLGGRCFLCHLHAGLIPFKKKKKEEGEELISSSAPQR